MLIQFQHHTHSHELIPPPGNNLGHIKTEYKRHWNDSGVVCTVFHPFFKHSAINYGKVKWVKMDVHISLNALLSIRLVFYP